MRFHVKLGVFLFAACALIINSCEEKPEMLNTERLCLVKRLAVLEFQDGPGTYGANSGNAVTGLVTSELARCDKYRILERSNLRTVIDEQDLQVSGMVDRETAIRVGKILGADAVVLGSVTQYDMDKTQVYIHMIPIVSKEYTVGAAIRMIDVETGEIIYAHSASGKSGNNFTEAGKQAAQRLLVPMSK